MTNYEALKRILITLLIVMSSITILSAQTEQVSFLTDKKVCFPGDTLWLRIFLRDTVKLTTSNNFYIELYKDGKQDTCVRRYLFPVRNSISMGQIEAPDSAGVYWLRGFTFNSANEVIYPFSVIRNTRDVVVKEVNDSGQLNQIKDDIVEIKHKKNDVSIHIKDDSFSNYSLSITNIENPDVSVPVSRPLDRTNLPDLSDSSILTYNVAANDVKFANKDVVLIIQKDTFTSAPQLISLDKDGIGAIPNLYFFDSAYVFYKLNNSKKMKESFSLDIHPAKFPIFRLPSAEQCKSKRLDMFAGVDTLPFITDRRTLSTFVVKGKWIDRNLELNKRYVMSSVFEPIEQFAYDLRDASIARFNNVRDFIYGTLPPTWARNSLGFMTGSCSDGVVWYEDEKRVSGEYINSQPIAKYAYIKAYADLQPCPCVLVYTRKGKDLQALPSQMKMLALKGYDKPLQWTAPDRITYHWNPFITDTDYKLNVVAKRFKVQIMGERNDGKPFFYEEEINEVTGGATVTMNHDDND
jgi:hypothetical protein